MNRTLAMIAAAALIGGCSSNDGPGPVDSAPDLRAADSGEDAPGGDGPAADAPVEAAVADSGADAVLDAVTIDEGTADAPPTVADLAADLPPDTAAKDAGPACGGGATLQSFSADMVICQGASVSQCDAAQLCGGWHLCSATEYRARGGETTAATAEAWLGACVRDGGGLSAPSDGACGACTGVASMVTTGWECDGSDDTATSAARVGVASDATCHRVGVNSASQQAYWIAKPSDLKLQAAVCCR